ncbi:MAG: hypothetical protein RLZZ449_1119 [Actinomycetota bacterium]|jgi:S-adenosylmethionine synthetase
MDHTEFDTVERTRPDGAFDFTRTYKIYKPGFFTDEMLGTMGASRMQILIKHQATEEIFSIGGSFVAGFGGEHGMETMHILVETAYQLNLEGDEVTFEELEIQVERTLMVDVENILTVDTQIPDDFESMNKASIEYIKQAMKG